jgi:SAM-dependent methyltransferase
VEQPPDSIEKFDVIRQHRRMLANMNCYLTRESKILDFGCGAGDLVYRYRDAGYDAYGFDIRPAPVYRRHGDERYFRFSLTGKPVDVPEFAVDETAYRIPFEDRFFDFVFSTSTLEHVQDHPSAFREMARVLKPGGVAIHSFPPRYALIEPHVYVPLGGAIRSYGWYLLWACLGVRNEFQRTMKAAERARHNWHYARTGIHYPPLREMISQASEHFREVHQIPHLWELRDQGIGSCWAAWLVSPRVGRYGRWLYGRCVNVILFLRK